MTYQSPHHSAAPQKFQKIFVCLSLIMATVIVYHGVVDFDFISLDDNIYIYDNPHVKAGLSGESVTWAFTNNTAGIWIPLTWLSYLAGISLHGLSPGWLHVTNVLIHLVNVILLLFLLYALTHDFWPSAFVAALFALHPLHVESVAWITERKDVLSTLFFLLTLHGYCRYSQRPAVGWYLATLMFYTLSLMSKPMYITLPFLLILIDYWPLGRFSTAQLNNSGLSPRGSPLTWLLTEKAPFFFLTAVFGILTYFTFQKAVGWMHPAQIPLDIRLTNVSMAYLKYIGKLIFPVDLAVLYPYQYSVSWSKTMLAFGLLAAATWAVVYKRRTDPFLVVGWFWFLGLLVPVIGLVNAGGHAMADRFAYAPFIGLYLIAAWGAPRALAAWKGAQKCLAPLAMVLLLVLALISWKQVSYWTDSETLFYQALNNTRNNWIIHNSLGNALAQKGKTTEAISHYRKALNLNPDYVNAYNNLGVVLGNTGQSDAAIANFRQALHHSPDYADAHYNLGVALSGKGQFEEAMAHYLRAIRSEPENAKFHSNLGIAFARAGLLVKAAAHFKEALRIDPYNENARKNLAAIDRQAARPSD